MENIQLLSLFITALAWFVVAVAACWIIYRVITVSFLKRPRTSWKNVQKHLYVKGLKLAAGISFALLVISLPFHLWIASGFRRLMPGYMTTLLLFLLLIWAVLELYLSFSISAKLVGTTYKKVFLTILVILLMPLSCYYVFSLPAIFTYPDEKDCYILDLPIKGEWSAGHAGGSEKVNYHCALRAQKYAIDITKVNEEGDFYKNSGSAIADFYTTGEPVYAPANGTVVRVVDSFENRPVMDQTKVKVNPAGNHVVVEIAKDRYLFLAHLNKGSISVKQGNWIKSGDLIGRAGNSGNTSWPHLHMHIQDMPVVDNKNATAYPFRFRQMERKRWFNWEKAVNGFLLRNDLFRNNEK